MRTLPGALALLLPACAPTEPPPQPWEIGPELPCADPWPGIDRLSEQGIVKRDHSTGDRRGVLVSLTGAGLELARDKTEKARRHEARILEGYADADIAKLKLLLRGLMSKAKARPEGARP